MFGHSFFGSSYFGPSYFGPAGGEVSTDECAFQRDAFQSDAFQTCEDQDNTGGSFIHDVLNPFQDHYIEGRLRWNEPVRRREEEREPFRVQDLTPSQEELRIDAQIQFLELVRDQQARTVAAAQEAAAAQAQILELQNDLHVAYQRRMELERQRILQDDEDFLLMMISTL